MTRVVKFGRKRLPVGHHWAVQVGDRWYEPDSPILVEESRGYAAASGAGSFGGEIAGNTDKTDSEIDNFICEWKENNPYYSLIGDNCQTFALEFIDWLTDGNYRVTHMLEAGVGSSQAGGGTFAASKDGIAIARASTGETRTGWGHVQFRRAGPSAEASAIGNTPIHAGVFADAQLGRLEVSSAIGGVHLSPNVNTGIGTRDGNLDVHAVGFGVRVGSDGLGIDTPLGGVTACSIM